jgi:putative nucleotidyltransferase with HDIG domain
MRTMDAVSIINVLMGKNRLPASPGNLLRLANELRSPDTNTDRVTKIISSDVALTAQLLKTSNSALYGSPRLIRSVPEAIVRLGFEEIRSIALSLQAKCLFGSLNYAETTIREAIWNHALKTAVISKCLGRKLNAREPDIYYTAAILHDIGKLILLSHDPKYGELVEKGKVHGAELTRREELRYKTNHAALGSELLRYWNLPDVFVKIVDAHHSEMAPVDPLWQAYKLLVISNALAHVLPADGAPTEEALGPVKPLLVGFPVTPELIISLASEFHDEFQKLKYI